jgi:hypothetical protein
MLVGGSKAQTKHAGQSTLALFKSSVPGAVGNASEKFDR